MIGGLFSPHLSALEFELFIASSAHGNIDDRLLDDFEGNNTKSRHNLGRYVDTNCAELDHD